MTYAIDAAGNSVANTSNLAEDNTLTFSSYDGTQAKIDKGHFNRASTFISDEDANNNSRVVIRDGSREYVANNDYRPTDILRIQGMEVTYEMAASLGLIDGGTFSSPQDDFRSDAENVEEAPQDTRPEATKLLEAQLEVALGDSAQATLDTFGQDIVTNGQISEEGLRFAQDRLGMSEQSVQEIYSEMQETGGQVMSDFLEVGDGLGTDRISFLVEKAESGNAKERAIIRNLWFQAATGKLTRAAAAEAFDYLYQPYED